MGTPKAGKANRQNPPPTYPARLDLRQLEAVQRSLEAGRPDTSREELFSSLMGFTVFATPQGNFLVCICYARFLPRLGRIQPIRNFLFELLCSGKGGHNPASWSYSPGIRVGFFRFSTAASTCGVEKGFSGVFLGRKCAHAARKLSVHAASCRHIDSGQPERPRPTA